MKTPSIHRRERTAMFVSHSHNDKPAAARQNRTRSRINRTLTAVLLLLTALARNPASAASGGTREGLSGALAQHALGAIYANIDQSEYEIHWQPKAGAYMAPNRAHNLRITFHDDGVTVRARTSTKDILRPFDRARPGRSAVTPLNGQPSNTWAATLHLDSYGRDGVASRANWVHFLEREC